MKNQKGQALVEFIIILPVTLMLIFCVIDFARVISLRSDLESITQDATILYQSGKTKEDIERELDLDGADLNVLIEGEYVDIKTSKEIKPITPGFSYILKDVFNVEVNRVIRNE